MNFEQQIVLMSEAADLCKRLNDEISILLDLADYYKTRDSKACLSFMQRYESCLRAWKKADERYGRRAMTALF